MSKAIYVLIADDHPIVREGLRTLLADAPDIIVVEEASTGAEALVLTTVLQPDVVLMDLVMPEMDGIEATRRICDASPGTRVLVLTSFSDRGHVHDAIRAGAIGYLLKDVLKAELLRAIYMAARGEPVLHPEAQRQLMRQVARAVEPSPLDALTQREQDVLRLIADGCSNKEISTSLHLTEGTVKGYVSAILSKLAVADRTQAALLAVKFGRATGHS